MYGSAFRKFKKDSAKEKLISYLKSELKINLPYLFSEEKFTQEKFNKDRTNFINVLNENSVDKNVIAFISNEINDLIHKGNINFGWKIIAPRNISVIKQFPQPRDKKWFTQFCQLYDFISYWNIGQNSHQKNLDNTIETCIAQLALSSIVYGGLAFEEGILSLINHVINQPKPLIRFNNTYWCDLILESPNFPSNCVINKQKVTIRRWFPDHISLMMIYKLLNIRIKKQITKNELNQYISHFIKSFGMKFNINISKISKLQSILNTAFGITELLPNVIFDQAHINYSRNIIISTSLRPDYWEGMIKNSFPSNKERNKLYEKMERTIYYDDDNPREELINSLNEIFTEQDEKLNNNDVLNGLYNIQPEFENDGFLLDWLRYNLEERKNAVSTTRNYKSAVVKEWISFSKKKSDPFDQSTLEKFYNDIFFYNANKILKVKPYKQRAFYLFHRYCLITYGFPEVNSFENLKLKEKTYVRAGFISNQVFNQFLNKYKSSKNDLQYYKRMMISIFIILYRTGLRVGEVLKIKLKDIEISDEFWIDIRENNKGDNKTYSSLRRIPLGILLKKEELIFLRNYFQFKLMLEKITNYSLAFSLKFTPNESLSQASVSSIFRKFLSEKYALPNVLHLLRHTAISRLYAVFTDNTKLLSIFSDYNQQETIKIQTFFNSTGKNRYWELAKFAGHSSPLTTFATYIHFCDIQMYSNLIKHDKSLTWSEVENISGCSRKYLTKYRNTLEKKTKSVSLCEVNKVLKGALNRYTKSIQNKKYKKTSSVQDFNKIEISDGDIWYILRKIENFEIDTQVSEKMKNQTIKILIKEFSEKINLKYKQVLKWYKNAKFISSIQTNKNSSAFFSEKKLMPPIGFHLAPARLHSIYESKIANIILDEYYKKWNEHNGVFKSVLTYFLNTSTHSVNGLRFSDPEILDDYLKIFSGIFFVHSIEIEHEYLKGAKIRNQRKIWKDIISNRAKFSPSVEYKGEKKIYNTVNKKHQYPFGRVTLKIGIPVKNSNPEEETVTFSSGVLKFCLHMISIRKLGKLNKGEIHRKTN